MAVNSYKEYTSSVALAFQNVIISAFIQCLKPLQKAWESSSLQVGKAEIEAKTLLEATEHVLICSCFYSAGIY